MPSNRKRLEGDRVELSVSDDRFPDVLRTISDPPEKLYVIGDVGAIREGLAVVGARKATPYGRSCALRFARLAAERGICIISGGARGCDSASHEAAIECGGQTVVFLGGGCDEVYPPENFNLFQKVIDCGGAVVSENDWGFKPKPYTFRIRNRLIAGLAKATLIVEAGLPSGTFSTADEALAANKEVLVVPGSITSAQSLGSNRLLYQGATPVVDDDTFYDQLFMIFGCMKSEEMRVGVSENPKSDDSFSTYLLKALKAHPMSIDDLMAVANNETSHKVDLPYIMSWLTEKELSREIARYPDGRFGAILK